MSFKPRPLGFLLLLACFPFHAAAAPAQTPGAAEMVRPTDFVRDFPAVAWGMSFEQAKQAVEKTGARPAGPKDSENGLAWEATFEGMRGRGAVSLKEGAGVGRISVGVYAFGKRAEVYGAWLKKLTERHGAAAEERDDEFANMKVWRLKNGFAIQLRTLKNEHSPLVEIAWVKG